VKQIRSVLCITNHLSGSEVGGAAAEMRLARRVLPWADAVVPVGDAVARDLAENIPGIEKKLRTIHNPVITDDLAERCAADPPHRWFEDGGPPIVIGCGRLEPQKDFATLLRAFALARKEIDARLVIVGGGPERRSLEALAASLGIDSSTAFLGRIDDPFAAMARSSVLVLSSRWEGLPNVVVEAMACGCPVVSTDSPGGSREALLDGELGPLVPPVDPRAMADAIVQVLREPPCRSALGARAAEFTEAKSVDAYLALFRSLVGTARSGGSRNYTSPARSI
jgi:glycosyltransferase involved in cell wall biosynthesis